MKVKVWNDNVHTHTEAYNGVTYTIEPKCFIEMEDDEATNLIGQYKQRTFTGEGLQDPRSYKMLRKEYPVTKAKEAVLHTCHACGKSYESPRMLEVHIDENHLDQLQDTDVATKRRGKSSKDAA